MIRQKFWFMRGVYLIVPFFCILLVVILVVHKGDTRAAISNGALPTGMIGQTNDSGEPDYSKTGFNDGPNKYGFLGGSDIAVDIVHHKLYLADVGNNRVLVFNLNPGTNMLEDKEADFVIGQDSFSTNSFGTSATSLNLNGYGANYAYPQEYGAGLAVDPANHRLFVADAQNNRVLVYNTDFISSGMAATYVLGQTDFTSSGSHQNTQNGFYELSGLEYDSAHQRLFVASYRRILVFDLSSGITNGMNADYVLGQADFSHIDRTGCVADGFSPWEENMGLEYDPYNDRLFVVDLQNSRVLVFDVDPLNISNGEAADTVIGQTSLTTCNGSDMSYVSDISYDHNNEYLYVFRHYMSAFVYDISEITPETEAPIRHNVFEATSSGKFVQWTAGETTYSYLFALHGYYWEGKLNVYDVSTLPDSSTNAPIDFLGGGMNGGPRAEGFFFDSGSSMAVDSVHHRLFVPDRYNRILVFNLDSSNNFSGGTAVAVLGQMNFTSSLAGDVSHV